jgi:putative hydrolase of the HAD superfamily
MVPSGIKNIIFDLGGVLLNIDPQRSIHAFHELGMADLIKPGGWGYEHEVFLKMEQGLLSEQEFRNGIRTLLSRPASDARIDEAWCAMLLQFPPEKIGLLRELALQYRLYLFSNTNSIHIRYFHGLFMKEFGFPLPELFVKDYYSSDIKFRKPDLRSFQFVLNDAGLNPSETLFIDDLDKNTEAAALTGMHTIYLKPDMDLAKLLNG